MDAIKGTIKGGRLDVLVPSDWPDGTEVTVQPVGHVVDFGVRESDWPDTPTSIADWLKWYDSLEPLISTPEEQATWAAAQEQQKLLEKASFVRRAEKLGGAWR